MLIGNGSTYILQYPNLTWKSINTLSASNFVCSGASLTSLNASNISSGSLSANGSGLTAFNAPAFYFNRFKWRNWNNTCIK